MRELRLTPGCTDKKLWFRIGLRLLLRLFAAPKRYGQKDGRGRTGRVAPGTRTPPRACPLGFPHAFSPVP